MEKIDIPDFLKEFDETGLPSDFLRDYELLECLSQNEISETFLIKSKKDGLLRVAKCYKRKSYPAADTESDILSSLHHEGLPQFVSCYENGDAVFVVREYITGVSLEEHAGSKGLPPDEALSIAKQLCDILAYLHGQKPPIIHRDIKPGNVIINDGKITLIDFGISRKYDDKATTDTTYIGTREFSPPEQFGFSQTDNRSDIYAFGVLLCYLLTGGTDLKRIQQTVKNKKLRNIMLKCTAFSPDRRYTDVAQVKSALLDLEGIRRYKTQLLAAAAVIVLVLAGITVYGRHRGSEPVHEDFLAQERIVLSLDSEKVPITRAEICRLLVDVLDIYDEYAESNFTDVLADDPRYPYISSAVQAKLAHGFPDGSFQPDEPISAGMYSVLIMENALGIYKVTDWNDTDKVLVAAAKAGNNYGIITDEQLEQAKVDPYQPMESIPEGILVPKAISGAWIEWKSSDESVATVDSGQVTPRGPGRAVITAEYGRGDMVFDTCEVIVN
ncbi:MAG: Serine/threonine-protein kinase PrkC [Pelotomaculum sp. PtaU1.Bin065]|nr:MAG: Serine/threonine-protein kinase PrkC [Pelotomaculum sp. PtaU1.Bin065]